MGTRRHSISLSALAGVLLIAVGSTLVVGQESAQYKERLSKVSDAIQNGDWNGVRSAAEAWLKEDPKASAALFAEDAADVMTKTRKPPLRSTADFPYSNKAACDQLLAWTQDLLVADPKNVNYLLLNGLFYVLGRGDFVRGFERFEKVIEIDPNNVVALGLVGAGYGAKNRLEDAVRVSEKALKIDPGRAQPYDNLGMVEMTNGHRENAEKYFKKAITCSDADAMDWFNLGSLYAAEGRLQDAKSVLLKAVTVSPNFYPAHWNLASVYYRLGMMDDCVRECKRVVELAPDSVEGQKAMNNLRILGK